MSKKGKKMRRREPFTAADIKAMRKWKAATRKPSSIKKLAEKLNRSYSKVRQQLQFRMCVSPIKSARTRRNALLTKELCRSAHLLKNKKTPCANRAGHAIGVAPRTAQRVLSSAVKKAQKRILAAAVAAKSKFLRMSQQHEADGGPTEINWKAYECSQRSQRWR